MYAYARIGTVVLGLALLAPPLWGQTQLTSFEQLEEIAVEVLSEGHVETKGQVEPIDATIPPDLQLLEPKLTGSLKFPTMTSSLDEERNVFDSYVKLYQESIAALVSEGRKAAGEHQLLSKSWLKYSDGKLLQQFYGKYRPGKRAPRAASESDQAKQAFAALQAVWPAIFPRFADVYQKAKLSGPAVHKMLQDREARAKSYLKRYNYGPGLVTTKLQGSALLWVELAPQVQQVAKDYLTSLNAPAVVDEDGKPLEWEGRKIYYLSGDALLAELRKALDELTGEFFVVRYAVKEGDKVTDIMRVTGARLLLGEFYFIEYDDKMVVVRK